MAFEKIISSVAKIISCFVLIQYAIYLFVMSIPNDRHYNEIIQSPNMLGTLWKKKARLGTLVTEFLDTPEFQKLWDDAKLMWAPESEQVSPK